MKEKRRCSLIFLFPEMLPEVNPAAFPAQERRGGRGVVKGQKGGQGEIFLAFCLLYNGQQLPKVKVSAIAVV